MSESQMEDYSCPDIVITQQVQTYMDMVLPMKMMFENMNKGVHNPMVDLVEKSTHQIGRLYSLFGEDYDGGDFCKGLLFSHEAAQLVLNLGRNVLGGMFNHEGGVAESEMPKLHDLLQG